MSSPEPSKSTPVRPPVRPFAEFQTSGLLWLVNSVVFHPRGFALGFAKDANGDVIGWSLGGDGNEAWSFGLDDSIDALFLAAEATLKPHDQEQR